MILLKQQKTQRNIRRMTSRLLSMPPIGQTPFPRRNAVVRRLGFKPLNTCFQRFQRVKRIPPLVEYMCEISRETTESEEREVRSRIDEFCTSTDSATLHIPIQGSSLPRCRYQQQPDQWRLEPIETWPVGNTNICWRCTEILLGQTP